MAVCTIQTGQFVETAIPSELGTCRVVAETEGEAPEINKMRHRYRHGEIASAIIEINKHK